MLLGGDIIPSRDAAVQAANGWVVATVWILIDDATSIWWKFYFLAINPIWFYFSRETIWFGLEY